MCIVYVFTCVIFTYTHMYMYIHLPYDQQQHCTSIIAIKTMAYFYPVTLSCKKKKRPMKQAFK